MKSSGLHIPLCILEESWEDNQNGGLSIRKSRVEDKSLSHRTFEELFNSRMAGSKPIPWNVLNEFYKTHKILDDDDDFVILHAQEFCMPSAEKGPKRKTFKKPAAETTEVSKVPQD